jgi:Tfp pilus assembly protein PilO
MLRKLIIFVLIVSVVVVVSGCKKKPAQSAAPEKVEVKSQAEYDAKAKKEITSENMKAELDKVENEIQEEPDSGGGV